MSAKNLLLSVIPAETMERLSQYTRTVDLPHGKVLHRPNDTIEDVYFPLTCLISITVTMNDGRICEAGIVGSRELVGINAFMGGRETNQTEYVTQVPGTAIRMVAEPLLAEFDRNKNLRDILLRFTQAYIAQLSQNVACNRVHDLNQRLARWLFESSDRLGSNDLELTHEFISEMLGVRRAGITDALGLLEASGIIKHGRKQVRILDPAALQARSCECYGVLRDEYDRLLGSSLRANSKPGDEKTPRLKLS